MKKIEKTIMDKKQEEYPEQDQRFAICERMYSSNSKSIDK